MTRKRTVILTAAGTDAESRTGQRFPLELPIMIRSQDSNEQAVTSDVSASGVYIHANAKMHVGTTIEFEIALPREVVGIDSDVAIHCKGRVIRMEENTPGSEKKQNGVGCVIDQYEFVRKEKQPKSS